MYACTKSSHCTLDVYFSFVNYTSIKLEKKLNYITIYNICHMYMGFPGGSVVRILLHCRRHRRCESDPWVRKIPWRRQWQPTSVFLPENRGAWQATVHRVQRVGHERLSVHVYGTKLCLKNLVITENAIRRSFYANIAMADFLKIFIQIMSTDSSVRVNKMLTLWQALYNISYGQAIWFQRPNCSSRCYILLPRGLDTL